MLLMPRMLDPMPNDENARWKVATGTPAIPSASFVRPR